MPSPVTSFRAHAHGPVSRVVIGGLRLIGLASLPVLLALVLYATDPPVTPPVLLRLLLTWTILPLAIGAGLERVIGATVRIEPATLVVDRGDVRLDVPLEALEGVAPWRVPLPRAGVWLRMRSGRRLGYGLAADDPTPLLAALAIDVTHPTLIWAHARAAVMPPRRWWHRAGKFGAFGVLPAAVLFNAHQHIAYGGPFGEWYLLGAASWFRTLAVYWGTIVVYLVLYAGTLRWAGELLALASAAVAPSRAAGVRRAVERACGIAYWGGVPVLLALRFLP